MGGPFGAANQASAAGVREGAWPPGFVKNPALSTTEAAICTVDTGGRAKSPGIPAQNAKIPVAQVQTAQAQTTEAQTTEVQTAQVRSARADDDRGGDRRLARGSRHRRGLCLA